MDGSEVSRLIERIRSGDRDAAAEFALRFGPLIRRRLRSMLGSSMRRIFDSEDILSTVLRRLDVFVQAQRVIAATDEQLLTLVMRISQHALIDKARAAARLRRADQEDGAIAGLLISEARLDRRHEPGDESFENTLERALAALDDETDRRILWLWLAGYAHHVTAAILDLKPDAVRKRWERIRSHLHERLAEAPVTAAANQSDRHRREGAA